MTTYRIEIKDNEKWLASSEGALVVIERVLQTTDFSLSDSGEVEVRFVETDGIKGGEVGKPITALTADTESVQLILRKRVSELKKTDSDIKPRKPRKAKPTDAGAPELNPALVETEDDGDALPGDDGTYSV